MKAERRSEAQGLLWWLSFSFFSISARIYTTLFCALALRKLFPNPYLVSANNQDCVFPHLISSDPSTSPLFFFFFFFFFNPSKPSKTPNSIDFFIYSSPWTLQLSLTSSASSSIQLLRSRNFAPFVHRKHLSALTWLC